MPTEINIPPPLPRVAWSWPLESRPRFRDASLGAFRKGKRGQPNRHHQGVDVGAAAGDVVLAMHPGRIIDRFGWDDGIVAVLVGDELGATLYGALEPEGLEALGLRRGDRVEAGQPIGKVGRYPRGTSMLHIEGYAPGTTKRRRWLWGEAPPPELRDIRVALHASQAPAELEGVELEEHDPPTDDTDEDDPEFYGLGKLLGELDKPPEPATPQGPTVPSFPEARPEAAGIVPLVALGAVLGLLALAL